MSTRNFSIVGGNPENVYSGTINTTISVSGSRIYWTVSISYNNSYCPNSTHFSVYDTDVSNPWTQMIVPKFSDDRSGYNLTFTDYIDAQKTSGTITFRLQGDPSSGSGMEEDFVWTETYSGATVYTPPTCSIAISSGSPYAGKTITLACNCSAGVTTGRITRYYKASNASSWTSSHIHSDFTSSGTLEDTVPQNYLGGKVYWRYDVSDGSNSANSTTNTITVINEPEAPPTISYFDFTAPTAGSSVTVGINIKDTAGSGTYVLYREAREPNKTTWNRTIVSSNGSYTDNRNYTVENNIPSDFGGYSLRYVLIVTSSSGQTAQATTTTRTVVGTTPEPVGPPVISNFNFATPTAGESCDISFIISDEAGSGTWTLYRESREPGGSSWERLTIVTGRKYSFDGQGFTYSNNIPANYGGYSIRFVLDVTSDSGENANATTSAKTVEGITPEPEPTEPPSIVEFDFDNPVAGSPCTVRITISDKAGSGTFKLYREYLVPGGASWERVNVDLSGQYLFDGARSTYGNNIPLSYGGYSLRYVIVVTSSSGQTAQATTESKTVAVDASCDIVLQTPRPYAGSSVTLLCTCSGNITSGTVRRYYKAAGASSWTNTLIQSGVTSRVTISDTLPTNYGGGQVFWRYEVNDGANRADTATATVIANSAPTTPATLTVSPTSISGGSTVTISWSASTDPDNNLAGYILERSIDGGSTWKQVYQGPELQSTDSIIFGTTRIRYRVKAYDTFGAESGYKQAPTSGDYSISNNRAPTAPGAPMTITPAQLMPGVSAVISWGASTDPDGDSFEYVLQRSVNNLSSYQQIYRGTNRNFTDTIGSWTSVSYRVKAVDSHNASSSYRVSETKSIISNQNPEIVVKLEDVEIADGTDLGLSSDAFSLTYTVSDENESDTLTVKEIVDGVVRKTVSNAVRGQVYTFNFLTKTAASSSYWNKLLDGTRTITFEVSDGKTTVRKTFTFLKNAGSCLITLKTAIQGATGKKLGTTALSICGSIPDECLTSVEVTADNGEHWESCVISEGGTVSGLENRRVKTSTDFNEKLLGGHYLFLHKFENAGNQFNFRILCTAAAGKNGWISSVQGTFTEESV